MVILVCIFHNGKRVYALTMLRVTLRKSFQRIHLYCYNFERNNLETVTHIKTSYDNQFEYFFMSIVRVCQTCLFPIIIIDRAHLQGKYLDTIFIAVNMDSNNQDMTSLAIIFDRANSMECPFNPCSSNTIAKSIKALSKDARKLPITIFLLISSNNPTMQCQRHNVGDQTEKDVTEYVQKVIKRRINKSFGFLVYRIDHRIYEVTNQMKNGVLQFDLYFCTCGKWKLFSIPCSHAIDVLKELRYQ
uniref:SWIM-type domain-containing protein n=1 Tax=Lactuca sativa TaxID=4236 RepID=A0A9R1X026_LACSA|nr:hypothetical protein LSAT_V11C800404720 [Lactuca sativa]